MISGIKKNTCLCEKEKKTRSMVYI